MPKNKKTPRTKRSVSKTSVQPDNKNLKYALIVAVLVLVLCWVVKKNNENNYMMQNVPVVEDNTYPAINNNSDLDNALKDLDKNDPVQMDKEIMGLDSDSSKL